MKIATMPIAQLLPAPYNPRKNLKKGDPEYEKLKKSLEEFGYIDPIVWNERTGRVVGGHQRLKILSELGHAEIEVSVVDLSDDKEKALNLALNKTGGDWDAPLLKDLLQELDTGAFDIEITGFDADEIERLMSQFHNPEITEDDAPAPPEEPIAKTGDLWQLGRHRLICGDCREVVVVDRLAAGQRFNMILTDPPYGVNYSEKEASLVKAGYIRKAHKAINNDAIEDYRAFFGGFLSIIPLADYNTAYIFMSGLELHNLRMAIEDAGFKWGDYLIWVKNSMVMGRKDYNAQHEFIVYAWKGRHKFYGPTNSVTVLEFNRPQKSELHPTMKPVALVARLMTDGSRENGLVYDPFLGSGTTLIAAEQTNRICYGSELDPGYCDVIVQRWETLTGQKAVLLNEHEGTQAQADAS